MKKTEDSKDTDRQIDAHTDRQAGRRQTDRHIVRRVLRMTLFYAFMHTYCNDETGRP